MKSVFITGASSGIGQLVVEALIGKADLILLKNKRVLPWAETDRLKILKGGLEECSTYKKDIRQSDVIIHIAAITHTDNAELYYRVNHEGTRQLLAAAHNSQHFIFISTRCVGEAGGAYSHSKHLAEQAIQNSGIPYTIIRPAEVYGSNPKEGIDALLRIAARLRILIDFKWRPEITYSPISVRELVDFILAVVRGNKHQNRIYALCNNENYTARQIAESLETRNAGHIYRLPVPLKLITSLLKLRIPLPFKRDQIARLIMDKDTDNKLAREDYGFDPVPFLDFIRHS